MANAEQYYETLTVSLTPRALEALAPLVRQRAEDEWDSGQLQMELANLANEFDARLQRIERGELQGK